MKTVSKATKTKSYEWIKRNARPLEAARWDYLFEGGSSEQVIKYLSAFQNEDGGFGNGIEPDFWLPKSSPMATWAGGQILIETGAEKGEKIVTSMLEYLISTHQAEVGLWQSVLPENNNHPHAPWWHWEERVQENWSYNPSAELAAFLVHWAPQQSVEAQLGWSTIEQAVNYVMNQEEMDKHQINNFHQLIEIMKQYDEIFNDRINFLLSTVSDKVLSLAERCVERDVSKWSTGYLPLPLDFINGPEHPLCERFGDLVDLNLAFYIDQMTKDGIWEPSWGWGTYPEEFPIAKRYWQGILTVNRYKILHAFGCVI